MVVARVPNLIAQPDRIAVARVERQRQRQVGGLRVSMDDPLGSHLQLGQGVELSPEPRLRVREAE